ncbi:MAG: hypothetical protein PHX05_00175 [Acidobacteriota bacterium]|nr:hypothetical protein [Acidobacteriota bacterium]
MNEWKQWWAVEWHEAGGLFVRRLGDAVAWALRQRKAGEKVTEAIVGVAEDLERAREIERELKRERRQGKA